MLSPSDEIWGMMGWIEVEDRFANSSATEGGCAISSSVFKVGGINRISPAFVLKGLSRFDPKGFSHLPGIMDWFLTGWHG